MMRLVDLVLTLPLIAVAAAARRARTSAAAVVGHRASCSAALDLGRTWPGSSAASVLSLREQEFIEAARALGASNARIIFRHLLPNALGPIIVNATITSPPAILAETALSFLGFGVQPPDTSLGLLVSTRRRRRSTPGRGSSTSPACSSSSSR